MTTPNTHTKIAPSRWPIQNLLASFLNACFYLKQHTGRTRPYLFTRPLICNCLTAFLLSVSTLHGTIVNCANEPADVNALQFAIANGDDVTINGICALGATSISIQKSMHLTGSATLNSTAAFVFVISADNVAINGLTFNGGGIHLIKLPIESAFTFTNNTVQNTNGNDGVNVDGILQSSNISNNIFTGIAPHGFASATYSSLGFGACYTSNGCELPGVGINIFGGMDQTVINENSFDLIANDAIHIGWNFIGATALYFLTKNNDISYNSFTRIHRIGIEAQAIWSWPHCGVGGAASCDVSRNFSTNTTIKGNYFHDPFLTYTASFAYSLALWGDGEYINNAAIANSSNSQLIGYGIEDMGNNVLTQGNVVAADYVAAAPHGWLAGIIYGPQAAGTTFITQNNVLCGGGSTTNNFNMEPASNGAKINQDNYIVNSCVNANKLTNSEMALSMTSPDTFTTTGTWRLAVTSSLPIRVVQFYLDNSNTPIVTQELQDVNTTFTSDKKWLYHATPDLSLLTPGYHTLVAKAVDVAGASQSISDDFAVAPSGMPRFEATPSAIAFASQIVGTASPRSSVKITNTGSGSLTLASISIAGPEANDFRSVSGCGTPLAVGASCTITVIFTPSTVSMKSGYLSINDNGAGSPHTILLTGKGIPPVVAPPPPTVSTLPTNLPSGMMLWLASDVGVVSADSSVSLWRDQSGNGNDASQPNQVSQPVLVPGNNGQMAVHFDGIASVMSISSLPLNGLSGMSVFLVAASAADERDAGYGHYAFLSWPETANWGATFFASYQTSARFRFGTTETGNENVFQMPFTRTRSFGLSEWMHDQTVDAMWFNAQQVASYSGKWQSLDGAGSAATLGAGQNSFYFGEASEVIVYNRALSAAERGLVEQYLMGKYHL